MSVEIIVGDALTELRELPDESVDICVTSPPYWGLRDYGVAGQLGLEPTLGEHLAALVELFEEVRRVLKPHGSLWLNYGDCYATAPNGRSAAETKAQGTDDRTFRDKPFSTVGPIHARLERAETPREASRRGRAGGLGKGGINGAGSAAVRVVADGPVLVEQYEKTPRDAASENKGSTAGAHGARVVAGGYLKPKDLCMIPNRLAIALQDAGWWVRSEIVWGKPNAMPDSSGAYRPSGAHEKVFLLTKSADADIWRARDTGELSFFPDLTERCPLVTKPDTLGPRWAKLGSYYDAEAVRMNRASNEDSREYPASHGDGVRTRSVKGNRRVDKQRGHARKHQGFAERWDGMSRDEQSANGRYLRNYEPDLSPIVPPEVWEIPTASFSDAHFATFPPALVVPCIKGGCPAGGVVLDPFGGAGTTGLVADRMGRDAILIELNPEYADMARERLRRSFAAVTGPRPKPAPFPTGLFAQVEVA